MMTIILSYVAIGVAICTAILIAHIHSTRRVYRIQIEPCGSSIAHHRKRREEFLERNVVPVLAGVLAVILWPLAIYWKVKEMAAVDENEMSSEPEQFKVMRNDLIELLSVTDIEQREIVIDPRGAVPSLPFGHLHPAWLKFKTSLLPDDEVWSFAASRSLKSGGQEHHQGYVIVREAVPGRTFLAALPVRGE